MAIEKVYLDPNAAAYTDDEIVGKVNTATATINRASSVAAAARPIAPGEVGATELADLAYTVTDATILASALQTGEEARDLIVALPDMERELIISRPATGQKKIVALQTHTDGKTEIEQNDTVES